MNPWKKIFVLWSLAFVALACLQTGILYSAQKQRVILVDPADTIQDWGTDVQNKKNAADITLAVALHIKKEMEKDKEWDVRLTREKNKDLDLEDKIEMIQKNKPDFLITLYVNRGFGKWSSGFEIYYPDYLADVSRHDEKSDSIALRNQAQASSLKMARLIQENLNTLFPRKSRGIRKASSAVNHEKVVPAVGVEIGFVTNEEDQKKLLSEKTQREIARALVKSIKMYYR